MCYVWVMARTQTVIDNITCDICSEETVKATTATLGWDSDRWEVDLCPTDFKKLSTQFDNWIRQARPARSIRRAQDSRSGAKRAPAKKTADDWTYLESLGFQRHRGRKRPEEVEALAARS